MTKIKICGMICEEDIKAVNKYLPDYIGFVLFFPKSKRNISIKQAKAVSYTHLDVYKRQVLWNVIRWAFMWYTQEFGYRAGSKISEDLSGGLLQKVTKIASILGMFVLGSLIERWVSINFTPVVSKVTLSEGAYIDWKSLPAGAEGIKTALSQYASGMALDPTKLSLIHI